MWRCNIHGVNGGWIQCKTGGPQHRRLTEAGVFQFFPSLQNRVPFSFFGVSWHRVSVVGILAADGSVVSVVACLTIVSGGLVFSGQLSQPILRPVNPFFLSMHRDTSLAYSREKNQVDRVEPMELFLTRHFLYKSSPRRWVDCDVHATPQSDLNCESLTFQTIHCPKSTQTACQVRPIASKRGVGVGWGGHSLEAR